MSCQPHRPNRSTIASPFYAAEKLLRYDLEYLNPIRMECFGQFPEKGATTDSLKGGLGIRSR
jgi:hypothetical protein